MKFKISKTAYDKLSDDLKAEYQETDDKKGYQLIIEGLPEPEDTGELRRARDREKERANNLAEELAEANTKIETLEKAQTSQDKDVARVTARFERKVNETKSEYEARVEKLKGTMAKGAIETAANALANDISTAPKVMLPHITSRLTVEWGEDDTPVVKVIKDGKPSDLKMEDLRKELVDNKDFAGIIRGTRATGGGAPANTPLNPGGTGQEAKPVDLAKADRKSFTDTIRQKVEERKQQAGAA